MASEVMKCIARETKVLNSFTTWYTSKHKDKIPITTFVSLPFEFQLGVLLTFFEEEYNYGIHADRESFLILYPDIEKAKDIILNRSGKLLDRDNIEYTNFNSIMMKSIYNYERALIEIVNLIINPF